MLDDQRIVHSISIDENHDAYLGPNAELKSSCFVRKLIMMD